MSLPSDGGSGSTISYPLNRLNESAQQIRTAANKALTAHEQDWPAVQAYVRSYPEYLQPHLTTLLNTYQQRLKSSYHTYLSFADWLDTAHGQMQRTDGTIQESFLEFLNNSKG